MRQCAALLVLMMAAVVLADDREAPVRPGDPATRPWRERVTDWPAEDVELLAKQKFLIRGPNRKQIFDEYINNSAGFVTTDSLLVAYNVLLEHTVRRLESRQAELLQSMLKQMLKGLPEAPGRFDGDAKLITAAHQRATIMIAVAARLAGLEVKLPADLAAIVDDEVKRVTQAEGMIKPAWLGPPDAGFVAIDYTRFKPRGFYAGTPAMERYFRVRSWLAAIPFRLDRDDELLSVLMIAEAGPRSRELEPLIERYSRFVGRLDSAHLGIVRSKLDAAVMLGHGERQKLSVAERLKEVAKSIRREVDLIGLEHEQIDLGGKAEVNDLVRLSEATEKSVRILPAHRTPDGVLFQLTTDSRRFGGRVPTGMEVAALLGSPLAVETLRGEQGGKVLQVVEDSRGLLRQERPSFYEQYLNCLNAVAPDKGAPEFMHSEAWQRKNCQTMLAGWALLRHTWALHVKQQYKVLGLYLYEPGGFVEPVPEFYHQLAKLIEMQRHELRRLNAWQISRAGKISRMRLLADRAERDIARPSGSDRDFSLGDEGDIPSEVWGPLLRKLSKANGDAETWGDAAAATRLIALLRRLADGAEREDPAAQAELAEFFAANSESEDAERWTGLATMVRQLEAMSHKQLRGVEFSEDERAFLKDYGEALAHLMFYEGHAYNSPRDDTPKVVDVFSMPDRAKFLSVGIGRPRTIYVLYPWKGREILCSGAVATYYEFQSDQRLTDAQWRQLLDSPQAPPPPEWLNPIQRPPTPRERED